MRLRACVYVCVCVCRNTRYIFSQTYDIKRANEDHICMFARVRVCGYARARPVRGVGSRRGAWRRVWGGGGSRGFAQRTKNCKWTQRKGLVTSISRDWGRPEAHRGAGGGAAGSSTRVLPGPEGRQGASGGTRPGWLQGRRRIAGDLWCPGVEQSSSTAQFQNPRSHPQNPKSCPFAECPRWQLQLAARAEVSWRETGATPSPASCTQRSELPKRSWIRKKLFAPFGFKLSFFLAGPGEANLGVKQAPPEMAAVARMSLASPSRKAMKC